MIKFPNSLFLYFVYFRPNEDDFTVLDLATLLNFDVMAAELLRHGARENPKCEDEYSLKQPKIVFNCRTAIAWAIIGLLFVFTIQRV